MPSSWTSQRQRKERGLESRSAVFLEVCPGKTRTVSARSPPLSPSLRQPPAPLHALCAWPPKNRSPGASQAREREGRGEERGSWGVKSHLKRWTDGSADQNLKNSQKQRRIGVCLHLRQRKRLKTNRRKHVCDLAERSGASWRGQRMNGVCEDVNSLFWV